MIEYRESTLSAAVNTVEKNLEELFSVEKDSSEIERYRRRWIWELIQNANDTAIDKVDINIKYDTKKLVFSHSGKTFDRKSLLSLITQISEKDDEEDTIGKFGTGFITTHLLNRNIKISGIYTQKTGHRIGLDFNIDRSSTTRDGLRSQISSALTELEKLEDISEVVPEVTDEFNTKFIYDLSNSEDGVKEAIKKGEEDFACHIPFVLAFTNKINSISFNGKLFSKDTTSTNKIIKIMRNDNKIQETINIFMLEQNGTQIAVFLRKDENGNISVLPYNKKFAKIFCKFPLIGTEDFNIPFVVNNNKFSVNVDRDSIFLGDEQNKEIMNNALGLYSKMLDELTIIKANNIYNLCFLSENQDSAYNKEIGGQARQVFSYKNIVKLDNGMMVSLLNSDGSSDVVCPYLEKEYKEYEERFWNLLKNLYGPKKLVCKEDYKYWGKIQKDSNWRLDDIADWIEKDQESYLKYDGNNELIIKDLLDDYYNLVLVTNRFDDLKESSIFLNEANTFSRGTQLKIDGNVYFEFKKVYNLLSNEKNENKKIIEEELFNKGIKSFNEEKFKESEINIKKLTNKEVGKRIDIKVRSILLNEFSSAVERNLQEAEALRILYIWMTKNHKESLDFFPETYNDRIKLYSKEEQAEILNIGEDAKKLMEETGIQTIKGLRMMFAQLNIEEIKEKIDGFIEKKNPDLNDIMQIIEETGATTENELASILQATGKSAEDIKGFMEYRNSGLKSAFDEIDKLIHEANNAVKTHLESIGGYDFSKANLLTKTIYDGVIRNGKEIKLIVRPSIGNKFILYYDSELDFLSYKNYELWLWDTEREAREITFGEILKVTGIRVIPLENLYKGE